MRRHGSHRAKPRLAALVRKNGSSSGSSLLDFAEHSTEELLIKGGEIKDSTFTINLDVEIRSPH